MSQQLTQLARQRLHQYSAELAKIYGVPDVSKQFAVTDPMDTKLRQALLESSDFLRAITALDVDQIKGQVVEVGIGGLYTGRKDGDRFRKTVGVDGNQYDLVETDSCAQLPWSTLCTWANAGGAGEFMRLVNDFSNRSFALDMLRVGFHGVSRAANTDPVANPNGEDVNKGWQQLAKEWNSGSQVITDALYFDPAGGGDYASLDAMASDLINSIIHPVYQNDPRLVVLVGADLVAKEQARLYEAATTPTEKAAAQNLAKSIAGRRAVIPPFFPGKRMTVTMLPNLHLYTQKGTRVRKSGNVEDRKAWENQYWRMEGYAIGDYRAYASYDESAVTIGAEPQA